MEETRDLIGKGPRTLMERAWMLTGHPADEEEVRNLTREYLKVYRDWETDRKSTRLNSSHLKLSRMPSSA